MDAPRAHAGASILRPSVIATHDLPPGAAPRAGRRIVRRGRRAGFVSSALRASPPCSRDVPRVASHSRATPRPSSPCTPVLSRLSTLRMTGLRCLAVLVLGYWVGVRRPSPLYVSVNASHLTCFSTPRLDHDRRKTGAVASAAAQTQAQIPAAAAISSVPRLSKTGEPEEGEHIEYQFETKVIPSSSGAGVSPPA